MIRENGRFERTVESICAGLELLRPSCEIDGTRNVAQGISSIARSSDVILIAPGDVDDDHMQQYEDPALFVGSPRTDFGLLPPSCYVFQAMPGDEVNLPGSLIDRYPGMYAVAHKNATSTATPQSLMNSVTDESPLPVVTLMHCEHPFAQALVTDTALNQVYGQAYAGIPISPNDADPDAPLLRGISHINLARTGLRLIENYDDTGTTAEWLADEVAARKDFFNGQTYNPSDPPQETLVAQAIHSEPIVYDVLRAMVMARALEEWTKDRDEPIEAAAIRAHRIIDLRMLH